MTLRRVTPRTAALIRDQVEEELNRAYSAALRGYLGEVKAAALASLPIRFGVLRASALPEEEPVTLGALASRWAETVDTEVIAAVSVAFDRIWERYTTQGLIVDSPAERAIRAYIMRVRDRLVKGTYFGVTVYDEAFEVVRAALADSVALGMTRPELAQRLATDLAWETDGAYWREVKAAADSEIDAILDALGPPGTPAREYARHNDPRVIALREQRNLAIKHLDAEKSVWKTRATLIARTEATGAANYGAIEALGVEGATKKMWLSTADARTRRTHLAAPIGVGGTIVNISSPFIVGGAAMQYPGDSAGPVEEVASCRCTIVNPDNL